MDEKKTDSVSVRQFVTSRTQELVALSSKTIAKAVGPNGSSSYIPFKHIPKNLRRRAVSHNVKRLPFRFRPPTRPGQDATTKTSASPSAKKGDPLSFISSKKKTKSSRAHKRRKSNLLLEFNRRQRVNKWMETHIWHAKRFHMEAKWNYKIPIRPCDKGQRALYRSTKNYATMQDITFISPFELTGQFSDLCSGFQSIAPKAANPLSIGAVMYTGGDREGQLHIYKQNCYPSGYIGVVNFMWLKNQTNFEAGDDSDTNSPHQPTSLWLWVHPAFKQEIVDQLCQVFDLFLQLKWKSPLDQYNAGDVDPSVLRSEEMSIDEIKLMPKNLSNKPRWSNPATTINLLDLEGELNRIRFSGPMIIQVLKDVLQPTRPDVVLQPNQNQNESEGDETLAQKNKSLWIDRYKFSSRSSKQGEISDLDPNLGFNFLTTQQMMWGLLETIEDFPSHTILPLTVRDPRVFLPKSRTKVLLNGNEDSGDDEDGETVMEVEGDVHIAKSSAAADPGLPTDSVSSAILEPRDLLNKFIKGASSPLQDPSIRSRLIKEKMTDRQFCDRRAGLLIPGSEIDLGREENQVPVTLIHRPASANAKSFNDGGFDLIIPAGWTVPFWIAFAYRATRVSGLRDATCIAFSTGNLHSPSFLSPDSLSGTSEAASCEYSNRENYFKFSPAKRPNLIKLNCASPFSPPWKPLLQFWNLQSQSEFQSSGSSHNGQDQKSPQPFILRDKQLLSYISQNVKSKFWLKLIQNLNNMKENQNIHMDECLIGVRLDLVGGGRADENAIICLPTLCDVENNKNLSPCSSKTFMHEEPPQDDLEFRGKRRELKEKHEKFLSFLRRKRKKFRVENRNLPFKFEPKNEKAEEIKLKNEGLLKHYDSTLLSQVYNDSMNALWLPPQDVDNADDDKEGRKNTLNCLKGQSRVPMGFVIYGDDEYSRGHCSALGYISAAALLQLARNAQECKRMGSFVLVRNWTNSLVYRSAKLQILLT